MYLIQYFADLNYKLITFLLAYFGQYCEKPKLKLNIL